MRTLIFALGWMACRTQPLVARTTSPSGATTDCHMQPVPLDMLQVDDLNLCPFDLVRVTYLFTIAECQPYFQPQVSYDAGSNTFTLTQEACPATCSGPSMKVQSTAILSETAQPEPGMLTVRDSTSGTSLVLPIQNPAAPGACGTVAQDGCVSSRECEAADPETRCWYDGSMCVHICYDDGDCQSGVHCSLGFCLS